MTKNCGSHRLSLVRQLPPCPTQRTLTLQHLGSQPKRYNCAQHPGVASKTLQLRTAAGRGKAR